MVERPSPEARLRFRPSFGASIVTVAALVILVTLGTWQLDRLNWKTDLLARIDERIGGEAVPLPAHISEPDSWDYRRVSVSGRYRHDHEFYLMSRVRNGQAGLHVVTPLERPDGSLVMVNRGWIPTDYRNPARREAGQVEGMVALEAVARVPEGQGFMQPDNDLARNEWYWEDLPLMARTAGAEEPVPLILEATAEATPPSGYPLAGQTRIDIPNNHLHYALTWYSLAATLLVIFVLFSMRRTVSPP